MWIITLNTYKGHKTKMRKNMINTQHANKIKTSAQIPVKYFVHQTAQFVPIRL